MGSLIFSCPKALPLAPYVPPHLHNVLYRPLVAAKPAIPSKAAASEGGHKASLKQDADKMPVEKDWSAELKQLEVAAFNLEHADESVLEDLEQRLLHFEVGNLKKLASSSSTSAIANNTTTAGDGDSPKLTPASSSSSSSSSSASGSSASGDPTVNTVKRPKAPAIELKEAGKGILVMPRVSFVDKADGVQKKKVIFADHVKPGDGTSSSEGEEASQVVRSPPLTVETIKPAQLKVLKKRVKKRVRVPGDDFDPEFDMLPPPPPPPDSPPSAAEHLLSCQSVQSSETQPLDKIQVNLLPPIGRDLLNSPCDTPTPPPPGDIDDS